MRPKSSSFKKAVFIVCLTCFVYPASLWGAETEHKETPPALLASIWELPKLYSDRSNPYIQSFSLIGRYHGQYWVADAEDNQDEDWENRRMYFGFTTKLFQQFTIEVQISLNDDLNPAYEGLYDAFIKWETSAKDFGLSIGRLDYTFTGLERSTSSKRIKTMERALLINQVMPGEVIGIYTEGGMGKLSYQTGLFSGSIQDEFTDFTGGFGALLGLGYKVPLFYETGTLHLDYLYNNGNEDNNAFKPYEHIASLWHQGKRGPFEIDIDVTVANGTGDQSDIFGFTLLPAYDFAHNLLIPGDRLQLALRYHYASSSEAFGLQFNKRYEQTVASGAGDSYNSYYLGLNYYIYQQKLKLMTGVEYFDMDDVAPDDDMVSTTATEKITGWSLITGVRLYF
jgi:phosphate-selective porin OprO and OprP